MSKHTPGPWVVNLDGADFYGEENGFDPIGGCGCCNSPWVNGDTSKERNANARLIGGAPELLEACKTLLSEIYALTEDGTLSYELVKNHQAIKFAENAIKKAEGAE